jgi:hypothetical protein
MVTIFTVAVIAADGRQNIDLDDVLCGDFPSPWCGWRTIHALDGRPITMPRGSFLLKCTKDYHSVWIV